MIISTAPKRTSKRWVPERVTWDGLARRLQTPVRTGETMAEYARMSADEKAARKDQGGFVGGDIVGGRRVRGSCRERWLVTLDADEAGQEDWEDFTALSDWTVLAYATHSSTPDRPRLRWVLPLTRAVSPEEYGAVARAVAELIGIETMDTTTYQPERLMYWPSCPADAEYYYRRRDGVTLDPDALLRERYGGSWRDTALWPTAEREQTVVLREAKKQGDPAARPGIVGLFCRAYDVPTAIDRFLPDRYTDAGAGRYTYTGGTTTAGAVLYDDGAFLYSHHDHDPAGGQLCNAFDLVRLHLFGDRDADIAVDTAPGNTPSFRAMSELASADEGVLRQKAQECVGDFADLTADGCQAESGGEQAEDGDDWTTKLKLRPKSSELEQCIGNAALVLRNDPALKGVLGYNEMSERIVLTRLPPWRKGAAPGRDGLPWDDADDANLRTYLSERWGLTQAQQIRDAKIVVASEHPFHPVRDYLLGLQWDGTERIETALIRWLGAEDTPYVRAVSRKWFTAGAKRMLYPGCKFDNLLLLIGAQGIGKSQFSDKISLGYKNDSLLRVDSKDAYEGLRGAWIVELAEMNAVKKSDVEAVKTFLSKRSDTFRPAYAENEKTFLRHCIFYSTTNDPETLRDRTGNRRWWCVECAGTGDSGVLAGLEDEAAQLWAEAVVCVRRGDSLWLDDRTLREEAERHAERHAVQDELAGEIEAFLDIPIPTAEKWESMDRQDRRDWFTGASVLRTEMEQDGGLELVRRDTVCVSEVRWEMMGIEIGRGNDSVSRRIANLLNSMKGWRRLPDRAYVGPYGRQRVYKREEAPPQ